MSATSGRRLAAELAGTAFLLAAVVGSGIAGERLSGGNVALALLANSLATGAALVAILLALGDVSAHLNPVVTLSAALARELPRRLVAPYLAAQLAGALLGVVAAHAMFGEPLLEPSRHARAGAAQGLSELVATFGLVLVVRRVARARPGAVPFAVAAYVAAAYWFTASTAFANPAVTLARCVTDTFAGIRPADAPLFVAAQLAGAAAAHALDAWLSSAPPTPAESRPARADRPVRVRP